MNHEGINMNKMRSLVLACVSVAAIASYTSTFAATRANTASLTLGAGYEYFDSKRGIDNTSMPMVMLGYNFTQHWGFEALLGIFNTNFKSRVNDQRQVNGDLFAMDAVYHFNAYKDVIEPFVLLGVGATGLNPNQFDGHNEGNANAGVGAQFFFDKSIAFRVEARDFYTFTGGKNDVVLDAGVTFLLDIC